MRETIELDLHTFTDVVYEEKSEYIKVQEEIDYVELGMGIKNMIMVVNRKSDGKFFKFKYGSDDGRNSFDVPGLANHFPIQGIEVFPEMITKTIYV